MELTEPDRPGLVSIILTTLNGARYIRQSIDSCLTQTYTNTELIVVDGGSTDNTLEIVATYNDPRIRVVHQLNNEGKLAGALNLGLAHAKGEYLTWHQDDSYYAPQAIELMVECLESKPEIGQVYTDWWLLQEDIEPEWIRVKPPDELLTVKSDTVGYCFLIRRVVRETIGEHSVEAYPSQDYDYRLRIAQRFESERLDRPLYYYRIHNHSLTSSLGWPTLARKDVSIRLALGVTSLHQARLDLADTDIAEAFESFQAERFVNVPNLVVSGLRQNPKYILNRGVWSILFKSLIFTQILGRNYA